MSTYTVVCYRGNGADYCRGCLMDSSDSAHEIFFCANEEEAAQVFAGKRLLDRNSGREVCDWEITVLVDGLDEQHSEYEENSAFDRIATLAQVELDRLIAAENAAAEAKRIEEERRKAQAKAQAIIDAEQRDRETYERLRSKYGAAEGGA